MIYYYSNYQSSFVKYMLIYKDTKYHKYKWAVTLENMGLIKIDDDFLPAFSSNESRQYYYIELNKFLKL